jgi:hypothetical protein
MLIACGNGAGKGPTPRLRLLSDADAGEIEKPREGHERVEEKDEPNEEPVRGNELTDSKSSSRTSGRTPDPVRWWTIAFVRLPSFVATIGFANRKGTWGLANHGGMP